MMNTVLIIVALAAMVFIILPEVKEEFDSWNN